MSKPGIVISVTTLAFLAGVAAGAMLSNHSKKNATMEAPAPAVIQGDGSRILERSTAPPPKLPMIPHHAKVERVETLEVLPNTPGSPVSVELALIEQPDGTRRVVASSEDGKIIGGIDYAMPPPPKQREYHWQVTALRVAEAQGLHQSWGASVAYTRGPWVIQGSAWGTGAAVGVGVRW